MKKTLVLVEGPKSAIFWRDRMATLSQAKWICYDARSAFILEEAGAQVLRDSFYLNTYLSEVKKWEQAALDLSVHWFENAPKLYPNFQPEFFYTRLFYFYFLALFRAFTLLERIHAVEGDCQILTTHSFQSEDANYGIRWGQNESPFGLLLRYLGNRWSFSFELFELKEDDLEIKKEPLKHMSVFREILASWKWRFRHADALFLGSQALLNPVRRALEEGHGFRTMNVKVAEDIPRLLASYRGNDLVLAIPPKPSQPLNFDEEAFRTALQDHGSFVIKGVNFLPIIWQRIRSFYRWEAKRAKHFYDHSLKLLDQMKPSCIVVDEDATHFNRVFVYAANVLRMDSWVVMHGLTVHPNGFAPLVAKNTAVWGVYERDVLVKWGVDKNRIWITGNPRYDVLCKSPKSSDVFKQDLCRRWEWDASKPIVLVIPGGAAPNGLEYVEERASTTFEILKSVEYFIRVAQQVPGVQFIYKFRLALWDMEIYKKIAKRHGGLPSNLRWETKGVAVDLMNACDLVLNSISSAALEAVLLRKPVVNMNFSPFGYKQDVPFEEHGIRPMVKTYQETLDLCQELAEGTLPLNEWVRAQEVFIEPFMYSRDGSAAQRVANLVTHQKESLQEINIGQQEIFT